MLNPMLFWKKITFRGRIYHGYHSAGAEVVLNGHLIMLQCKAPCLREGGKWFTTNLNVDASAANANVNLAEGTSVSNLTVEARRR